MMTKPSSKSFIPARMATVAVLIGFAVAPLAFGDDLQPGPPAVESVGSPVPVSGTLMICGGGTHVEELFGPKFVELAGGENAHIVVVTTASETADSSAVDSRVEFWRRLHPAELTVLHTRSREIADDPKFSEPLATATGVWFIGGHQQRVTDAYLGTRTEKAFKAVLRRGGVLAGTSAGAAIMSPVMILGGFPNAEIGQGFGFLPGTIVDQHFLKRKRKDRLLQALAAYPKLVGFGIDEDTALVVRGRRVSVMGESDVMLCLGACEDKPAFEQPLEKGKEIDLLALGRAAVARVQPRFKFDGDDLQPSAPGGTVVLCGGGEIPEAAAERFIEASGGTEAPIVVVTTANGEKPAADSASIAWIVEAGAKNVRFVHPRTRAEADDPALLALLRQAGGVWFTGGRQWRLIDALQDSEAEKEFHALLTRGGAVGGNGGGASILADYLVRGSPLSNREIMARGYEEGFGFLRGVAVDPFFTQRNRFADMARLKRAHPQLIGLGIDEDTALIIKQHAVEVVGKNNVVVYDHREPGEAEKSFEFLYGDDRYDLAARERLGPPREDARPDVPSSDAPADEAEDPEPSPPLACE